MSGEQYGAFQHGGVRYPLSADTTNEPLRDADPSVWYMLEYLSTVLNAYFGARLEAEALRFGLKIDAAVRTKMGVEITPEILAENFQFPLLAVYRLTENDTQHTVTYDKDVAEIGFAWVLPVMTGPQIRRIAPIRRSVSRVIRRCLRMASDPNYLSAANVRLLAGWQHAKLRTSSYGSFAALNQPNGSYRAITGIIELVERDMPVQDAFEAFAGADIAIANQHSDGTVSDDIANVATQPAPTIALVTPNSGTKTGGTPVTITGTGFTSPMGLTIGGVQVPATVLSATSITATTPPHDAWPTFMADVIVANHLGQLARLPAGFTFTSP